MKLPRPIRLGGSMVGRRAHVCAFFNSPAEEYEVLVPFIKEGLELGEKAVHTVDPQRRHEHLECLASGGINIGAACENGQFELRDWSNTHLRDGQWNVYDTLALLQKVASDAKLKGFPLTRFVTHMEWTLKADMDVKELLEYEARANDVWIRQSGPVDPVICTYNLNLYTGDIIMDVMRTHPMVIIGGMLQINPFFVPPDEFLKKLRARPPAKLGKVK